MSQFFDALKAGAKAAVADLTPGEYTMAGRPVRCGHCGGAQFVLRSVPANEVAAFALRGFALRCETCTHVMLFGDSPARK